MNRQSRCSGDKEETWILNCICSDWWLLHKWEHEWWTPWFNIDNCEVCINYNLLVIGFIFYGFGVWFFSGSWLLFILQSEIKKMLRDVNDDKRWNWSEMEISQLFSYPIFFYCFQRSNLLMLNWYFNNNKNYQTYNSIFIICKFYYTIETIISNKKGWSKNSKY